MANNKCKLETIVVVDENGCVLSVEFIHRNSEGEKITIIRKENGES